MRQVSLNVTDRYTCYVTRHIGTGLGLSDYKPRDTQRNVGLVVTCSHMSPVLAADYIWVLGCCQV
jgi:hypothetical protein